MTRRTTIKHLFWALSISLSWWRTTAFVSFLAKNDNAAWMVQKEGTAVVAETKDKNNDCTPKDIMNVLMSRYRDAPESGWSKTRNYVYRLPKKNRLKMEQVEHVVSFLDNAFPNDPQLVASVLQTSPRILRKNPTNCLSPVTAFLKQLYGPDLFREAVSRNPDLLLTNGLGYDGDKNPELERYMVEELGIREASIRRIWDKHPVLLRFPVSRVQRSVQFFLELGGRDEKWVGKVMVAFPHLFRLSVEDNLLPSLRFLESYSNNAARVFQSNPALLGLSVKKLRATIDFLLDLLSHDKKALDKCITSHPAILGLSLKNLQQKVDYFGSISKMLPHKIATKSPAVFSLSTTENLVPTVAFLGKVWGNRVGSLLVEFPSVLTLSLEGNLQPTMEFYNQTGYTTLDSEWHLRDGKVVIRGRHMAASLFNRLLPRWHFLAPRQQQPPPLHILVGNTDEKFCRHFGVKVKDYIAFKAETASQLKFSSQFKTWLRTGRAIDDNLVQ